MKKILQQWAFVSCLMICFSFAAAAQDEEVTDTTKIPDVVITADDATQKQPFLRRLLGPRDSVAKNKSGIAVKPSVTFGIGYRIRRTTDDKEPFGQEHSLMAYYAINRGAFFVEYRSLFNQAIGNWNLGIVGRVFLPNVVNYFGIGNETKVDTSNNRFYRLRSSEAYGGISINRLIDSTHFFEVTPFYQLVNIRLDEDRFIGNTRSGVTKGELDQKNFAGIAAAYQLFNVNNTLTPTKGFGFCATATYTMNVRETGRQLLRYSSYASVYLPILRSLTLAVRAGGATNQGESEFFQLNTLGGNENLRGFQRQRFYGKTSFYNNNELRWLTSTSSRLFSRVGLLAFVDNGRVWHPGEESDTWHTSYGPGLIIIPYNRVVLNGTYGISDEDKRIHLRIGYLF